MKALPHHYRVRSAAGPDGEVRLDSAGLEPLPTHAPAEFGGPGDRWSPETLLVGAIADCFVLSFRAVARSAHLPWIGLDCEVEGVLDRVEGVTRFTAFALQAHLQVPEGVDPDAADRALHRAEQVCLISNSLSGRRELHTRVESVAAPPDGVSPVGR